MKIINEIMYFSNKIDMIGRLEENEYEIFGSIKKVLTK